MPVSEDSSIVPDSTLSSSPPAATPAVRRVARTYGRPRVQDAANDSDTSRFDNSFSSESRDRIYKTGPPELDEEIPPSSDPQDDDEAENASQDAPSTFQFSWKKKLRRFDEQDDSDIDSRELEPRSSPPSPHNRMVRDTPTSPVKDDSSTLINVVFGGSLDTLTTSPSSRQSPLQNNASPDVGPIRRRSGKHTKRIIRDSDSEVEEKNEISPSPPFPIASPRKQSSLTPPTSDDELPARVLPKAKSKSKGKAKAKPELAELTDEEASLSSPTRLQKKVKEKAKKSKIKAPTKKELQETVRNRARIAVDQEASIPRVEGTTHKYTIQSFLRHVALGSNTKPLGAVEADSIGDFSSDAHFSPQRPSTPGPSRLPQQSASPHSSPKLFGTATLLKAAATIPDPDDDDVELPDIADLVAQDQQEREREKKRDLLEQKRRILQMQKAHPMPYSDDSNDDELRVVPSADLRIKAEEAERKSGRKTQVSRSRQKVLQFAGVGSRPKGSPVKGDDLRALKDVSSLQKGKAGGFKTPWELNQFMVRKVERERVTAIQQKEAHWKELGGILGDVATTSTTVHEATKIYAQKALELIENGPIPVPQEDESDEDWAPEGSGDEQEGSGFSSKGDEDDADVTMVNEEATANDDDLPSQNLIKKVARKSKAQLVLDSDSEGENMSPTRTFFLQTTPRASGHANSLLGTDEEAMLSSVPKAGHRGSVSSFDERTEDEGDKENDTSRMFDHSENKENKAVVRHGADQNKFPVNRSLGELKSRSSKSLTSPSDNALNDENDDREPFKELDADPFASPVGGSPSFTPFAKRLQQASPVASLSSTARSAIIPFVAGKGGFSQFDDEPTGGSGLGSLESGFDSDSEGLTTKPTTYKKPGALFGLAKLLKEDTNAAEVKNPGFDDDLSLTQDVALAPAFQMGGNILRKADQIFEKEQEYLIDAATRKNQDEPELYVNDHGFLTQTRPDVSSPEVYRRPPNTQPSPAVSSSATQSERRPLRTLSLAESDFDSASRPQRLHKRAKTPPSPLTQASQRAGASFSPSLAKRPVKNAFDVLGKAAKSKNDEPKSKLQVSEFLEDEAQESDDDEMLGFGLKKKDDDEEGGEDLDKTLEALIDDRQISEDEVAADLVLEKVREHAEQDDEALQKLHEAAAHGELRKKKRGHFGLEDGEDDSDEDDADGRRRRNMYKKPRIDRDNIKELAADPETKSFYDVYEQDLNGENAEFGYLVESQPPDIIMQDDEDDKKEEDEGDGEDDGPRFVTHEEIRRRVREMPLDEEADGFDPHNVGWIDQLSDDDDEDGTRVKVRKQTNNRARPTRGQDQLDTDIGAEAPSHKPVPKELDRLQSWASAEGRSRTLGTTGRSVGGAAVTGHKAKAGGGSMRNAAASASTSNASRKSADSRRELKGQKSFLAGVAAERRNTRFG